jgi:hypothetical protein
VEYYRTKEGRLKKEIQNGKRGKVTSKAGLGDGKTRRDLAVAGERRFDAPMVSYLQMVTSLVEGRRVSVCEILEMLARVVRQHSMARGRRIDYVLVHLRESAP